MFALAVERAPIVVWRIDAEGRFTLSTGRGLQALGLQPGEAVGRSVFDMYRDFPDVLQSLKAVLAGEEQQIQVDLGGTYFDSWMRPLFDQNGGVRGAFGIASDATSRVRAEAQLRSSAERFLRAFNISPTGILLADLTTDVVVDVNPLLCELTGYTREQMLGQTVQSLGFWRDAAEREAALVNVLARNGLSRFRIRTRLPTGRPIELRAIVETIELDGRECALYLLQNDRRERQMQRALKRTRRRYRALSRFAPVGIFQARSNGELRFVNESFGRLLARPRQELKGNGWWSSVLAADQDALRLCWQDAITARKPLKVEFRAVRPGQAEDKFCWLELQLEPAPEGTGFLGALTDIDHRKRSELQQLEVNQQLEENVRQRTELLTRASRTLEQQIFERRRTLDELQISEQRWRALVELAPDVIMLVDRDGTVTYINHTRLRPSLEVEQVIGESIYSYVYEEYRESVREAVEHVFDTGESLINESEGPDDHGQRLVYQSHMAPIHYGGKTLSVIVIVRDITAERHANEALRQTQHHLAHAGRVSTVGQLMAGFAHEIGQPLLAIISYIDGCRFRLEREQNIPVDVLQVMREAVEESNRVVDVVKRLRDFLRKQEIQRSSHDLNQIVRDAAKLAEFGLNQHRARCELHLANDKLLAEVDRIQIMQVLANLVLNAAEAMDEARVGDATVRISTERTESGDLICRVADNGPGLPDIATSEIFESFFTTKASGLGLGLSISRSLIAAHNGTITAANRTPVGGAVFTIQLPGLQSFQE